MYDAKRREHRKTPFSSASHSDPSEQRDGLLGVDTPHSPESDHAEQKIHMSPMDIAAVRIAIDVFSVYV